MELDKDPNRELETASTAMDFLTDADKMSEGCLRAAVYVVEDLMSSRARNNFDRKVTRACCARINNAIGKTIELLTKAKFNINTLAQLNKEQDETREEKGFDIRFW